MGKPHLYQYTVVLREKHERDHIDDISIEEREMHHHHHH